MKKNFLKKLAFTMAFATAFTALSPAAGVFAASKPSLSAKSATLLLNDEARTEVDFNVKNKVKGSTYKWTTSNKAVATVNAKNGVVEAKKIGKATITLTITLPTKKTQKLTAAVTVKENIDTLKITNLPTAALKVGAEHDFNRSYTTVTGGKTTDITRWEVISENKANATIDEKGVFVATTAGEYEIVAKSFQSAAKYADYLAGKDTVTATSESYKVTVAASITGIKQTTPTEFEVNFDTDMSKVVTKDNLIIEANDNKQRQIVEKVTFADADKGLKATVKTYLEFRHDVDYKVSVDKTDLVKEFKASKGEAVSIKITGPSTVVFGKETVVEYGIYDANDVKIATSGADLTIVEGNANGYIGKDKDGKDIVNIFEKDKTITLKARYSTGKVDPTKYEIIYLEDAVVITSREALPTVVSQSKYTVAKEAPKNWDDFTQNTNIGLNDTNFKLFVQLVLNVDGKTEKITEGLTFESMDLSKLLIGVDGNLVPIATGTAHVKVSKDNLSVIVPVNVGSDRKAVSWAFDSNSKTVSNALTVADTVEFKATAKDNYNGDYAVSGIEVKPLNNAPDVLVPNGDKVVANGELFGELKGTFQYQVKFGDLISMLTVVVKDGRTDTKVQTWKLEAGEVKLNTVRNNDNPGAAEVAFTLFGYNAAGVKVAKNVNPSVTKLTASSPDANGTAGTVSGGKAFVLTSVSGTRTVSGADLDVVVKAKAGTYLFEAKDGDTVLARTAIVVEDTQTKAVVAQTNLTLTVDKDTNVLDVVRNAFDAYVGSDKLNDNYIVGVTAKNSNGQQITKVEANGTIVITEVEVAQVFDNGKGVKAVVIDKVAVSRPITITVK